MHSTLYINSAMFPCSISKDKNHRIQFSIWILHAPFVNHFVEQEKPYLTLGPSLVNRIFVHISWNACIEEDRRRGGEEEGEGEKRKKGADISMSVIWAFDNACLMVNTPMPWRPVDVRWVHKTEKGDEGAWKEGGREGWKKTGNGVEKGEERGVAEGRGTGVQHICRLPYGDTRKPSWALSLFSMADYRSILPHRKQERLPLRLPHRNSCWETATATTRIYIREGNSNFVLFTGPPAPHLLNLVKRSSFLSSP